jgi:hypothetical protein
MPAAERSPAGVPGRSSVALSSGNDVLLRYISPEIEFMRVGLVESWRRGLPVVMRH